MSEISIIYYDSNIENAHIDFARIYFNNRRKRINPDYIRWKFGTSDPSKTSMILAISNGLVVGQLGLIPTNVILNGEKYEAHWACDLMVHRDFRGKGVARMLYNKAISEKITLGSDPSPSATLSMSKFGFQTIDGPWKFFFPLNSSVLLDLKFKLNNSFWKLLKHPMLLIVILKRKLNIGKNLNLIQISLKDIDWSFKNDLESGYLGIEQDYHRINIRLGKFLDYRDECLVFQETNKYILLCDVSPKKCLIAFFQYQDEFIGKKVLEALIYYMYKKGIQDIRWMANNKSQEYMLKSLGFIKFRTRTKIIYCSQDPGFNLKMQSQTKFHYTFLDSDENI